MVLQSKTMRPNTPLSYGVYLAVLAERQKDPAGTPAYSRRVNRPLGRRAAAAGAVVGMSPNTATVLSALSSGAGLGLLFLAEPSVPVGVGVAVLLALGYVLDSADGQLARLRGTGSLSGEWLDHTVDCMKTCLLHLAVLVSFFRFPPVDSDAVLIVPMVFLVVDVGLFFGMILIPFLRRRSPVTTRRSRREHPAYEWLVLPNDYGLVCWTFVLLPWAHGFLAVYTLLCVAAAGLLVLAWAKWWRELRALDRGLGV